MSKELLLLPQRYKFSSKSQHTTKSEAALKSCYCYRKDTNFQANHNYMLDETTARGSCYCYRKDTNFQANHNLISPALYKLEVVIATAKIQIFKQITTLTCKTMLIISCYCYRKDTNFQANHNRCRGYPLKASVVIATAKIQIFKQITTSVRNSYLGFQLLLLPQRYKFSSKSQLFPANSSHVVLLLLPQRYKFSSKSQQHVQKYREDAVVIATAKIQIFKQITTTVMCWTLL